MMVMVVIIVVASSPPSPPPLTPQQNCDAQRPASLRIWKQYFRQCFWKVNDKKNEDVRENPEGFINAETAAAHLKHKCRNFMFIFPSHAASREVHNIATLFPTKSLSGRIMRV